MAHLFSPLPIDRTKLPNRIVMGPSVSGLASSDGFINDDLRRYYLRRARSGVGLIITEAVRVIPPSPESTRAHIGLYSDAFVPQFHQLVQEIHASGARLMIMLDEPAEAARRNAQELTLLVEAFISAAWRALATESDGVMFSVADGGVLHTLVSPLLNERFDAYGGALDGRLRLPLEIIEGVRTWLGGRLLVGLRLLAEEFAPGGLSLHDARVIAKRVVAAGARLIDVAADCRPDAPVARFPGWCMPLAESIKRVVPDVPIIGAGSMGDPYVADSAIRDGSVDLVMLEKTLRLNPDWPSLARSVLTTESIDVKQTDTLIKEVFED
jgi:2,4-dienoyl-CoA reductase-like NADH-dependent reductase (Old Yellow Enzyme family)